jgi:hypothetical protein
MIDWASISLKDFAGFISEELRKKGIDTILVGGACVTIYTQNRYQSYDLDYITYEDIRKVKKVLIELGFRAKNKYFQKEGCPWFVEFVSPPAAVGGETVKEFNNLATALGTIKLLHPLDSVKDRLSSFYHWNDPQGLEQAVNICLDHRCDLKELEEWSSREGKSKEFQSFLCRLNSRAQAGP